MTSLRLVPRLMDVTILVLALVFVGRLGVERLRPVIRAATTDRLRPIEPGRSLHIPGISWTETRRHVVLYLSTKCHACEASIPLYKELSARLRERSEVSLIFVSAESDATVRAWANKHQIQPTQVVQLGAAGSRHFYATPTLLIVNDAGMVTDTHVGRLRRSEEERLFDRVTGSGSPLDNTSPTITKITYGVGAGAAPPAVIDIRSRSDFARSPQLASKNLPQDELVIRAALEIGPDRDIVIDCTHNRLLRCHMASLMLKENGLSRVAIYKP